MLDDFGLKISNDEEPKLIIDVEFYNNNRQKLILMMVFWITYIIAYFLMSRMVCFRGDNSTDGATVKAMNTSLRRRLSISLRALVFGRKKFKKSNHYEKSCQSIEP